MEKIKEVIVVEGRDDTAAVRRAVDAQTIETHGFGMNEEMWQQIERAAATCGIIVLTDPDYPGEYIRRKIRERFPGCKEAFLPKEDALKQGNVGVENASPEAIRAALARARSGSPAGGPAGGAAGAGKDAGIPAGAEHADGPAAMNVGGTDGPAGGADEWPAGPGELFTAEDLMAAGLAGPGSRRRRERMGNLLGIGYGNSKTFLAKLNGFGVSRDEFQEALAKLQ